MARQLGIGSLSKRTGCKVETVRFYEREGLMPSPPRTPGGHRLYDEAHLKRLTFIRRSRELGFTLDQVRGLLRIVDGDHVACSEVKGVTLEHLDDVKGKIADLRRLRKVLEDLAARCAGDETPDCPIIEALFER